MQPEFLPSSQQPLRNNTRGGGAAVSIHKDNRACTYAQQALAEDQACCHTTAVLLRKCIFYIKSTPLSSPLELKSPPSQVFLLGSYYICWSTHQDNTHNTPVVMRRLKKKYSDALEQIDEHLAFWPKFLVHKNKQRLTKITQYLIRMRRLAVRTRPKLVPLATRFDDNALPLVKDFDVLGPQLFQRTS